MAVRRPLVVINGVVQELPEDDTLPGGSIDGGDAEGAPLSIPGLTALYLFDENSGTVTTEESGNFSDAVLTSDTLWTSSGIKGSGLKTVGSEYVDLGAGDNLYSLSDSVSMFCWLYYVSGYTYLLSLNYHDSPTPGSNVGLLWQTTVGTGTLWFRVKTGVVGGFGAGTNYGRWDTGLDIEAGWNLIATSRDLTVAKAYVYNNTNGLTTATLTGYSLNPIDWGTGRKNILLGHTPDTTASNVSVGSAGNTVDMVGIIDGIISQDDVERLWNSGAGKVPVI